MTAPPSPLLRSGDRALVVGLGKSGLAMARYLAAQGLGLRVVDQRPAGELTAAIEALPSAQLRTGGYDEGVLDGCAIVCASPGVPWDAGLLEAARRRGIPVTSEIDLFLRRCPGELLGVTGTNGKTTATAMLGTILRRGDRPVLVGGNIGDTVLDRLPEVTPEHRVVLELSSFQLESAADPRCQVGVVLNVTPDHLDRHHSFERYLDAKARLVEALPEGGVAILNGEDPRCRALASRTRAHVVWYDRHRPQPRLSVPGRHNQLDALAAAAAARAVGFDDDQIQAGLDRFTGVEHRLELVGEVGGVRWYNDSKATNPEAGLPALRAFPGRPLVVIAGGHGSFEVGEWTAEVRRTTVGAVLLGESAPVLAAELEGHPVRRAASLEEAVEEAARLLPGGGVVVLSPAYKSYDMFHDFEERGRTFKRLVRARGEAVMGTAEDG
ncbi:MAG: UDP-N-acetylmuramoyl-L-alanine--D-glutamate ligase [Candidatus Dormibacteraceae bacterium]